MEGSPGRVNVLSAEDLHAVMAARDDLKVTALIDTNKRGLPGVFVFVSLWPIIGLLTDLRHTHLVFVAAAFALFLSLALIRVVLYRRVRDVIRYSFPLARALTLGLILTGALAWGIIAAATIHYPSFQSAVLPMIVVTPAITAGGTNILAIDRGLRFSYPLATMGPAVIALAFDDKNPYHLMLVFMALLSCVYFMLASGVVQRDYWEAQKRGVLLQERARQMEDLSQTDALTQLRNRLYFTTHFEAEWKRACRHHYSVAILLIDLDHFKKINDTYGHPFGDLCLQQAAGALRTVILRAGDIIARYGGEEFIVFLSNTDPIGAQVVAERVLKAVRGVEVEHDKGRVGLTCSIGLASYVPAQPNLGYQLISQADELLYQAKRQGRNRVASLTSHLEA
jgi:diguanylate cyclase (GGDEF)-like protein